MIDKKVVEDTYTDIIERIRALEVYIEKKITGIYQLIKELKNYVVNNL